jgi:hypothetical protein
VIHDITSIDESAIYIRLLRQQDGVAIGRTALPHLPSSRQQVLLGAGRSNMTPLVSSTVKQIPTDVLMSGAVQFQIKVNRNARIDTASATSQPTPATTAAGSN